MHADMYCVEMSLWHNCWHDWPQTPGGQAGQVLGVDRRCQALIATMGADMDIILAHERFWLCSAPRLAVARLSIPCHKEQATCMTSCGPFLGRAGDIHAMQDVMRSSCMDAHRVFCSALADKQRAGKMGTLMRGTLSLSV